MRKLKLYGDHVKWSVFTIVKPWNLNEFECDGRSFVVQPTKDAIMFSFNSRSEQSLHFFE
jgi:hypothetical protein